MSKADSIKAEGKTSSLSLLDRVRIEVKNFNQSYALFWKSRTSWAITVMMFCTILCIQATVAMMSYSAYQNSRVEALIKASRTAISSVGFENTDKNNFISNKAAQGLLSQSSIQGFNIHTTEYELVNQYGQKPRIMLHRGEDMPQRFVDNKGHSLDYVFSPNDLGHPYYITARLDTRSISQDMAQYGRDAAVIILLLSALLTTVLMTALGYWFLQPTVTLTRLLKKAIANPETPQFPAHLKQAKEQGRLGDAMSAAMTLIEQNAQHIKQVKSTAESEIKKLAYFDALTELPNRTMFIEKLREYTKDIPDDEHFVVVTVDLDHFRQVNESMGHSVGDVILQSVAKRLRQSLPKRAIVARIGEDDFAVMLPIIKGVNTPKDIAQRVIDAIRGQGFTVMEEDFRIHCSVGYAVYPEDGSDPSDVLKNADIALSRAKEDGRDMIRAYSRDFDMAVQARFHLLKDLRHALENEEFELHFQPQFDLRSQKIIGAEALIRWWKPDNSKQGGMYISPGEFIPIAESSGLIVPIGEWVFKEACMTVQKLQLSGLDDLRVAVNVSGVQFRQPNLVETLQHIIYETGLDPKNLEIEVTESTFMGDINNTIDILKRLHETGVELAIDDFGTGYSSLAYLRQFPIDRLKIDRSFIMNALNNSDDASITRTIIALGHALNLKVLAEGVETIDHQTFLLEEGCDEVQGFRYAKPLPKEAFIDFCQNYKGDLSVFDKA
ncbi:MAG: GGDEF-domain containing protein [Micavibrio sp.]|nr:GGDEF-domain containing protein [Micavibrio sp.]